MVSSAWATTWFVNDTSTVGDSFTTSVGAAGNTGVTPNSPKRHVQEVMVLWKDGDIVYLDAGIHNEGAQLLVTCDSLTIQGVDSEATIIDFYPMTDISRYIKVKSCTGVTLRNFAVMRGYFGVLLSDADTCTISGVRCDSNSVSGFRVESGSCDNEFRGNSASGNPTAGFQFVSSSISILFLKQPSMRNSIVGNRATGNGDGFNLSSARNLFFGNISAGNQGMGFNLAAESHSQFAGNTITNNGSHGFQLVSTTEIVLLQNTFDSNGGYAVSLAGGQNNGTITRNIFQGSANGPDSILFGSTNISYRIQRNWWGTTDSISISWKIHGTDRGILNYTPFLLHVPDSIPGVDTIAPRAPDSVAAQAVDSSHIAITWSPMDGHEEVSSFPVNPGGYVIYRSLTSDTSQWTECGSASSEFQTFTDSGLAAGGEYFYRVSSMDAGNAIPNRSFYSDSIAHSFTHGASVVHSSPRLIPHAIGRSGAESAILAFTVSGANSDTLISLAVRLSGNIPPSDIATVRLYRDNDRSARYEENTDSMIAELVCSDALIYRKTNLSVRIDEADSFLVTINIEDTAHFADTFEVGMAPGDVYLALAETGPGTGWFLKGAWTIHAGIDSSGPNVWYINDTSLTGDSFTVSAGSSTNNGLTRQSPMRRLRDLNGSLTPGDTIMLDRGIFEEPQSFQIETHQLCIMGRDSASTVVSFGNSSDGISGTNRHRITVQDLKITASNKAVRFNNVDSSSLLRLRLDGNQLGIEVASGSCSNLIEGCYLENNAAGMIEVFSGAEDNCVMNNVIVTAGSNSYSGIYLDMGCHRSHISGNTITGPGRMGLYVAEGRDYRIMGNTIIEANEYGLYTYGCSNAVFAHNLFRACGSENVIYLGLYEGRNNVYYQNTFDANSGYLFYIADWGGTPGGDSIYKNNFNGALHDTMKIMYYESTQPFDVSRNWWGTTESSLIRRGISGPGAASVRFAPFRLGPVNTAEGADTIAPRAPDTVALTAIDSTRIQVSWSKSSTHEESTGAPLGLAGYRIYRGRLNDTSAPLLYGAASSESVMFTDSNRSGSHQYYYRISAVDGATPYPNESYYSESICVTGMGPTISLCSSGMIPSLLKRAAVSETMILALSIQGASEDTLLSVGIHVAGRPADIDAISFYRDINRNARFDSGVDAWISRLTHVIDSRYHASMVETLLSGGDSFFFTMRIADTALFSDTFHCFLGPDAVVTGRAGTGPPLPLSVDGIWNIDPEIFAAGPNVWYLNDESDLGDSFTAATGASWYNGLTIQTPRRYLFEVIPFLSAGDTILIDAGTYLGPPHATEAQISNICISGKDSSSTMLSYLRLTGTALTLKDFSVNGISGGNAGIHLNGVNNSLITRIRSESNINGFLLDCQSSGNILRDNYATGNIHGFRADNAGANLFQGNVARANRGSGFHCYFTSNDRFVGNVSMENDSDGFHINQTQQSCFAANYCARNGLNGFQTANVSMGNLIAQNTMEANGRYAFAFSGVCSGTTLAKNGISTSTPNPDSGIWNDFPSTGMWTGGEVRYRRNWFGSTNADSVSHLIWGPARQAVVHAPFRLGEIDSSQEADTVAPQAPDTVMATTIDSSHICVTWSIAHASEEQETSINLAGYRVYRSTTMNPSHWILICETAGREFTDSYLGALSTHNYRITAVDAHSPFPNESFFSDSIASAAMLAWTTIPSHQTISHDLLMDFISIVNMPGSYNPAYDVGRNGPDGILNEEDLFEIGRRYDERSLP
ncbi:MAG: NosD domain-containing protein [Candidatus Hydrogenedentota bacterium]